MIRLVGNNIETFLSAENSHPVQTGTNSVQYNVNHTLSSSIVFASVEVEVGSIWVPLTDRFPSGTTILGPFNDFVNWDADTAVFDVFRLSASVETIRFRFSIL